MAKELNLREGSLSMAPVLSHRELSDGYRLRSLGTAAARLASGCGGGGSVVPPGHHVAPYYEADFGPHRFRV